MRLPEKSGLLVAHGSQNVCIIGIAVGKQIELVSIGMSLLKTMPSDGLNWQLKFTFRKICLNMRLMTRGDFTTLSTNCSDFFFNSGQNSKILGKTCTGYPDNSGCVQFFISCSETSGGYKICINLLIISLPTCLQVRSCVLSPSFP